MAARIFLCPWTGVAGGTVSNPVHDYVGTTANQGFVAMYYGDADNNGLPDYPLVLVLVYSSNFTGAQIENNVAANVPAAHLIPPIPWNTVLSSIPTAKLQAAQTYLANNGIDTSSLTLQNTYGDLVKRVVNTIAPLHGHPGLKDWALTNAAEFG